MDLSIPRVRLSQMNVANRVPVISVSLVGCLLLMALAWRGGVHPTLGVGHASAKGGVATETAWEAGLVHHHLVFRIWRWGSGAAPTADGMTARWSVRGRSVGPDQFLEAHERGIPGLRFSWYRTQLSGTRGGRSTTVREFRVFAPVVVLLAGTACGVARVLRNRRGEGRPGFAIVPKELRGDIQAAVKQPERPG